MNCDIVMTILCIFGNIPWYFITETCGNIIVCAVCANVVCMYWIMYKPAPIMLENLPIILLRISQNFHLLFFCA